MSLSLPALRSALPSAARALGVSSPALAASVTRMDRLLAGVGASGAARAGVSGGIAADAVADAALAALLAASCDEPALLAAVNTVLLVIGSPLLGAPPPVATWALIALRRVLLLEAAEEMLQGSCVDLRTCGSMGRLTGALELADVTLGMAGAVVEAFSSRCRAEEEISGLLPALGSPHMPGTHEAERMRPLLMVRGALLLTIARAMHAAAQAAAAVGAALTGGGSGGGSGGAAGAGASLASGSEASEDAALHRLQSAASAHAAAWRQGAAVALARAQLSVRFGTGALRLVNGAAQPMHGTLTSLLERVAPGDVFADYVGQAPTVPPLRAADAGGALAAASSVAAQAPAVVASLPQPPAAIMLQVLQLPPTSTLSLLGQLQLPASMASASPPAPAPPLPTQPLALLAPAPASSAPAQPTLPATAPVPPVPAQSPSLAPSLLAQPPLALPVAAPTPRAAVQGALETSPAPISWPPPVPEPAAGLWGAVPLRTVEDDEEAPARAQPARPSPAATYAPSARAEALTSEAALARLSDLSASLLGDLLALNAMKRSGTRKEMQRRAMEGWAYGTLPRCPKCTGGFLMARNGMLSCPGRFDEATKQRVECGFAVNERSSGLRGVWRWA